MKRIALAVVAVLVLGIGAEAQKREVGFLVGGLKAGDRDLTPPAIGSLKIGTGLTYQIYYAQRMYNYHLAALYFEVPLAVTPSTKITSSNVLAPSKYSTIFITPGLKLKLLPGLPISPYAAAGVGYARFNQSSVTANGQTITGQTGTNRAVFDFGGGVDVKVFPFVSLRGEIRDFISGKPSFNLPTADGSQRNLLVSGGIVLRF